MTTDALTKSRIIADQNDLFRVHSCAGVCVWKGHILHGQLVCTSGIQSLRSDDFDAVLYAVRDFDSFTPDNDPRGERDFGSFEMVSAETGKGFNIFWKFDYYAPDYEHGSKDAADPRVTRRILTIMLSHEY